MKLMPRGTTIQVVPKDECEICKGNIIYNEWGERIF